MGRLHSPSPPPPFAAVPKTPTRTRQRGTPPEPVDNLLYASDDEGKAGKSSHRSGTKEGFKVATQM